MLILCQGGDILHMIGLRRLIKTSVEVTDSSLKTHHGFPSLCSMEKSKKSSCHICCVVLFKQDLSVDKNAAIYYVQTPEVGVSLQQVSSLNI